MPKIKFTSEEAPQRWPEIMALVAESHEVAIEANQKPAAVVLAYDEWEYLQVQANLLRDLKLLLLHYEHPKEILNALATSTTEEELAQRLNAKVHRAGLAHALYAVVAFEIVGDYTLRVAFDDGTEQVINLEPILYGNIYGPLRDRALFNQVKINPANQTLTWPNGADFDPETLRNWPTYKEAWIEQARRFSQVEAPAQQ